MPINSGRTRVLVVEDEQDIAGLIKHALEREGGFVIDIAGSGDAALKCVAEELPDLVLLDLNLPKLSGHEVLFKIKSSGRLKHIPVVVLTSSSAPSDVRRSYQRNADCFVTKAAGLEAYAREIKVVEALLPH